MTTDNACIGWYWLRSIVSCTTDDWYHVFSIYYDQKQGFRGVLIRICSENMQQNYRRTPMPKCGCKISTKGGDKE